MANKDDYLTEYRQFFEEFANTVEPNDQLPVKLGSYKFINSEVIGGIVDWCLQYLNRKSCPSSLVGPLIKITIDEIRIACKKHPVACGFNPNENVYEPLKLMQTVMSKVNEVCLRYLDNVQLDTLPSPPTVAPPPVSTCASRNTRRRMEDRHVVIHDINGMFNIAQDTSPTSYYAIFDGHAGPDAASYSAAHLHQFLVESEFYPTDPERALKEAFLRTDEFFLEKSKIENFRSGTTAVCALLRPKEETLYVAWVGDSQALLVNRGKVLQIVKPHKPCREDEKDRIEANGGCVMFWGMWRVNGQLAVSRAIGDLKLKPYVTAEPDIVAVPLDGNEEFLIIACDGLWDFVSEDDAAIAVYNRIKENPDNIETIAESLSDLAKQEGSRDNISIIIIFLKDPAKIAKKFSTDWGWPSVQTTDVTMETGVDNTNINNTASNNAFDLFGVFQKRGLDHFSSDETDFNKSNGTDTNKSELYHFEKTSNGKRRVEDEFDEDEEDDFGPETDVDGVDDVLLSPMIAAKAMEKVLEGNENNNDNQEKMDTLDVDLELQRQQSSEFEPTRQPREETPTPPADSVLDSSGLADNVAESEESEDEWNYYRVDHKEKESSDPPLETNNKVSPGTPPLDDMSQLNPDAKEFVPVSPTRTAVSPAPYSRDLVDDALIAQSPRRAVPMDISVPSPNEFQLEVKQRPSELFDDEFEAENTQNQNGHQLSSQEIMQNLLNGKDVSEIEFHPSNYAKPSNENYFGNNLANNLIENDTENSKENISPSEEHPTESSLSPMRDESDFASFVPKPQDPMSMSFYQDKDEGIGFSTNPFDLNKVQVLPEDVDEFIQPSSEDAPSPLGVPLSPEPSQEELVKTPEPSEASEALSPAECMMSKLEVSKSPLPEDSKSPVPEVCELSSQSPLLKVEISQSPVEFQENKSLLEIANSPVGDIAKSPSPLCEISESLECEIAKSPIEQFSPSPICEIAKSASPVCEISPSVVCEVVQSPSPGCDVAKSPFGETPQSPAQSPFGDVLESPVCDIVKSASPVCEVAKSPIEEISQSPICEIAKSASPVCDIAKSASPVCEIAKSPVCEISQSPVCEIAKSPIGEISQSPICDIAKSESPVCEILQSPVCEIAKSPVGDISQSPVCEIAKSPIGEVSQSPICDIAKSASPVCEISQSPVCEIAKSPLLDLGKTPEISQSPICEIAKSPLLEISEPVICEIPKSPILDVHSPMELSSPVGPLSPKSPIPELTGLVSPDITASIKDENISGEICETPKSPVMDDVLKSPLQELETKTERILSPVAKSPFELAEEIKETTRSPVQILEEIKETAKSPFEAAAEPSLKLEEESTNIYNRLGDEIETKIDETICEMHEEDKKLQELISDLREPERVVAPKSPELEVVEVKKEEEVNVQDVVKEVLQNVTNEMHNLINETETENVFMISGATPSEIMNSFLERSVVPEVTSPLSPVEEPEKFQTERPESWKENVEIKCETIKPEFAIHTMTSPSEESKGMDTPPPPPTPSIISEEPELKRGSPEPEKLIQAVEKLETIIPTEVRAKIAPRPAPPKTTTTTKKPLSSPSKQLPAKTSATTLKKAPTTKTQLTPRAAAKPSTPTASPRTTTSTRTTPKPATPTTTTTRTTPKPAEKKPLTNGDVKPAARTTLLKKTTTTTTSTASKPTPATTTANKTISATAASKLSPAKPPARTSSAKPAAPRTSTAAKPATAGPVPPKTRPASLTARPTTATSATTKTATSRPATAGTVRSTTTTTAKPKPTTTTVAARARPTTTARPATKAPDTEKQIKETANKQLSAARTSTSRTTTTTAAAAAKTTSTTARKLDTKTALSSRTTRTTTSSLKSTTKKPTEVTRTTSTTKKAVTKPPAEQNGVVNVIQEITTTTIITDDPQLLKDNSPIENLEIDNSKLTEIIAD